MHSRLFRDVEVEGTRVNVRVEHGIVTHVVPLGTRLRGADDVVHGGGGALLPGLHDHHLHLLATAARLASVPSGPDTIHGIDALRSALRAVPGQGWIRATEYDETVAGRLDRHVLDDIVPDRPVVVRDVHGTSVLNSRGVALVRDRLGRSAAAERDERGVPTGRLRSFDEELASLVVEPRADLAKLGRTLAAYGVTSVTDASPFLDHTAVALLSHAAEKGTLPRATLLGVADDVLLPQRLTAGPLVLPMRSDALPTFTELSDVVREAHDVGRPVAFDAVSTDALALSLSVLELVGRLHGDRIELSTEVPSSLRDLLVGLPVVTRPGMPYGSLLDAGLAVVTGSGAPEGALDPWAAIAAAATATDGEAVSADRALAGYLSPAHHPGGRPRRVEVGERANLMLLDDRLDVVLGRLSAGEGHNPVLAAYEAVGQAVSAPQRAGNTMPRARLNDILLTGAAAG